MTRAEFGAVIAYLTAGCGKPLAAESINVYASLLSDLPLAALQVAAWRALAESQYNAFPTAGVLRRLAVEVMVGEQPTAAEAWKLVKQAMIAPPIARQQLRAAWPDVVREAVECIGWNRLCESEDAGIIYAQFTKAYEALATVERRKQTLPAIARDSTDELSQLARRAVLRIGHMPEE